MPAGATPRPGVRQRRRAGRFAAAGADAHDAGTRRLVPGGGGHVQAAHDKVDAVVGGLAGLAEPLDERGLEAIAATHGRFCRLLRPENGPDAVPDPRDPIRRPPLFGAKSRAGG